MFLEITESYSGSKETVLEVTRTLASASKAGPGNRHPVVSNIRNPEHPVACCCLSLSALPKDYASRFKEKTCIKARPRLLEAEIKCLVQVHRHSEEAQARMEANETAERMKRFSIIIYMDEHVAGDIHYHVASKLGQKTIFARLKAKLPALVPEGFHVRYYQDNERDIGVLDERDRQHVRIRYVERRFPHSLHISFLQDSFKPILADLLQRCFPKAEIEWIERLEG